MIFSHELASLPNSISFIRNALFPAPENRKERMLAISKKTKGIYFYPTLGKQ